MRVFAKPFAGSGILTSVNNSTVLSQAFLTSLDNVEVLILVFHLHDWI